MEATSNGLFAVIQALAAANTAGVGAQNQGLDSLSTSEFMTAFSKKLAEFHGNMAQIEEFIQNYLNSHAIGSTARGNMSSGSVLSLGSLSSMLNELKADDQKIQQVKDKLKADNDTLNNQVMPQLKDVMDDLGIGFEDLDSLTSASSATGIIAKAYAKWYGYYMARGGFLSWFFPPGFAAVAALAAAKVASLIQDAQNLGGKVTSLKADIDNQMSVLSNLQKNQETLVMGKTGDLQAQGNALKAPAHSVMDDANQIATMSLMFLESLERLVPQQV
jgi:hypothetical protein